MKKLDPSPTTLPAGLAIAPVAATTSAYAASFTATQSADEHGTASIISLPVENLSGEKLGTVNSLVLDDSGKARIAVIGVRRQQGERSVAVPFAELTLRKKNGRRIAIIDATKDTLARAPKYVWSEKSTAQKLDVRVPPLTKKTKSAASG
ncbi:MAG: PRC-barrel domain-containing protein [Proteobacteria bacterium]|nr:PRC-barrel domain-containing protein [Pseudomonadota bacterium]